MRRRKKGGQPYNQNAVKHGRYSKPLREKRMREFEARRDRERAWWRSNPPPRTDYAAICSDIVNTNKQYAVMEAIDCEAKCSAR